MRAVDSSDPELILAVASVFTEAGQARWWEEYEERDGERRRELVDDLYRRVNRDPRHSCSQQ